MMREAVVRDEPVALAVALAPAALRGARIAVTAGAVVGSIHTAIDDRVLAHSRTLLLGDGDADVIEYPCDGEAVSVFIEPIGRRRRLIVVGATEIAMALTDLAKVLGYHVTIVDPRSSYLTRDRFPGADRLFTPATDALLDGIDLDASTYVVTLTHEPRFDVPTLAAASRSNVAYIGALGSRKTHAKRLELLRAAGLDDDQLARIHGPVGLDIGGRRAEEIALSIVAQMQAVRFGKHGRAPSPSGVDRA
jgi:xanthine dehydrogenase accessory factor